MIAITLAFICGVIVGAWLIVVCIDAPMKSDLEKLKSALEELRKDILKRSENNGKSHK